MLNDLKEDPSINSLFYFECSLNSDLNTGVNGKFIEEKFLDDLSPTVQIPKITKNLEKSSVIELLGGPETE